ncbi:MAG: hypothetical protein H6Q63_1370 [Firmicutes bacterium]|nr:hypothetical protein [Bacillota bacterium]
MRHSRYVWILGITLMCLIGITAWKSPQVVMVALAEPQYADSPRVAVQRFWGYLDSRQLDLAEQLLVSKQMNPLGKHEVELWEAKVGQNPLITLKKLDFVDSPIPNVIMVKVEWSSPLDEKISETYVMETQSTPEGWKIVQMKKVSEQSLASSLE